MTAPCAACLGTKRCWICDGAGCPPTAAWASWQKYRCTGDGVCPLCVDVAQAAEVPVQRSWSPLP